MLEYKLHNTYGRGHKPRTRISQQQKPFTETYLSLTAHAQTRILTNVDLHGAFAHS